MNTAQTLLTGGNRTQIIKDAVPWIALLVLAGLMILVVFKKTK
jgi:hypothetical protein